MLLPMLINATDIDYIKAGTIHTFVVQRDGDLIKEKTIKITGKKIDQSEIPNWDHLGITNITGVKPGLERFYNYDYQCDYKGIEWIIVARAKFTNQDGGRVKDLLDKAIEKLDQ